MGLYDDIPAINALLRSTGNDDMVGRTAKPPAGIRGYAGNIDAPVDAVIQPSAAHLKERI